MTGRFSAPSTDMSLPFIPTRGVFTESTYMDLHSSCHNLLKENVNIPFIFHQHFARIMI
jgi:hypothetical protein